MPGLPSFADFMSATRDVKLTSKQELLNEASKRTYLLGAMSRGRGIADTFKGGKQLTERIMGDDNGSFHFYNPGEEESNTGADVLRSATFDWRFAMAKYVFFDEETELNQGDEDAYIDLKMDYEQQAMTSNFNGMENALWATPNATTMETNATGNTPKPAMSLPVFNNEFASGLPTGFTTIGTVDPTVDTFYKPNRTGYTAANIASTAATVSDSLLAAMDDMWLSMKFEKLEGATQYFENDDLKKMKIVTNRDGHKTMSRLLRALNNRLAPDKSDPAYSDPMYNGYPITYIETLDTAAIYSGAAVGGSHTSGVANTGYPRIHWYNFKYIYPVFHTKRYLFPILKDGGATLPTGHVMFYNTWYQLVCRSRRRGCGTVYPSA